MRETANTNDIKGMRETGSGVGRQSDEQYRDGQGKLFGVHNRSCCYCKAQGLSYLFLDDNC